MKPMRILDGVRLTGRFFIRGWEKGKAELDYVKSKGGILMPVPRSLLCEVESPNKVMTGNQLGSDILVQYLLGNIAALDPAYEGINFLAFGTSQTPVTSADTQLGAETNRSGISYTQDISYNEAVLQAFFPDINVTNQTYYEVGAFVNGTASANSGLIYNHSLLGTAYAKSAGMDTTVEADLFFTT